MCGIAAGRLGPREALPAELREREGARSDRKPRAEIARRGILGKR